MKNRKALFIVFILLALAQLIVPAKMVFDSETILFTGKEYRFRTAPIDPLDYFRGKYVSLSYDDVSFETDKFSSSDFGKEVFVVLATDESGFASIKDIVEEAPDSGDYVKAKISYVSGYEPATVMVEYPFDRFYMDEFKAQDAELAYAAASREKDAYTIVRVKEGNAVIEDVIVEGKPIKEAAENYRDQ
jgi:uncharacterized membrane-anchored protein